MAWSSPLPQGGLGPVSLMVQRSIHPACAGCTASERQGQGRSRLLGARLGGPGAQRVLRGVVSPTRAGGFPGRSWQSVPGHLQCLWLPQRRLAVTRGARPSRAQRRAGFQQATAWEGRPAASLEGLCGTESLLPLSERFPCQLATSSSIRHQTYKRGGGRG